MTLKQYLALMSFCTALCWVGWGVVVRSVDPADGVLSLGLFYASLGLSLVGTFSVIGLAFRALSRRHEAAVRHVPVSLRQGVLLTTAFMTALVLQSRSLLTGLNSILLIGILCFVELFFISSSSDRRPRT
jgi:hypothetical protein